VPPLPPRSADVVLARQVDAARTVRGLLNETPIEDRWRAEHVLARYLRIELAWLCGDDPSVHDIEADLLQRHRELTGAFNRLAWAPSGSAELLSAAEHFGDVLDRQMAATAALLKDDVGRLVASTG
jgi:hypothetical protein